MGVGREQPSKMKAFVLICMFGLSLCSPIPEEAAAPAVVLPYAYPELVAYPYALPVYPNILHTGLHYPLAETYVHDTAGDVADDASPAAVAYTHDATGDVADDASPAAEAYVHDATGDVSDDASPEAEAYVHDPTGDA